MTRTTSPLPLSPEPCLPRIMVGRYRRWRSCDRTFVGCPPVLLAVVSLALGVVVVLVAGVDVAVASEAAPPTPVVDISNTPRLAETEEYICADPSNPQHLIMGSNVTEPLTPQGLPAHRCPESTATGSSTSRCTRRRTAAAPGRRVGSLRADLEATPCRSPRSPASRASSPTPATSSTPTRAVPLTVTATPTTRPPTSPLRSRAIRGCACGARQTAAAASALR